MDAMGASLWDQLWLPLLIGLAIQIVVAALCFMSVRLRNFLMRLFNTRIADGVPDLGIRNDYGPAQGGESMTEPELELQIVNGGEGGESIPEPDLELGIVNGGQGC